MQNRIQLFDTLSKALAYMLGGMFLYVNSSTLGQVFGAIFMAFAFVLIVSVCINRLTDWIDRGHRILIVGLFFATVVRLIATAAHTGEAFYIVLCFVFLVLIIVGLVCYILRKT